MQRGFTLIELLIVVAIVSVFASVVLIALTDEKEQAHNQVVATDIKRFQALAELYIDERGSYDGFCNHTDVTSIGGFECRSGSADSNNPKGHWVVWASVKDGFWCVDRKTPVGSSNKSTTIPTGDTCL